MKVIGFDKGGWPIGDLALRMSGLLGMAPFAEPKVGSDGIHIGDNNDYWLYPSREQKLPDGTWELHARYERTLRENGVQEALLVILKERFHLRRVFIIDLVNVPGDKQHTRLVTIEIDKKGGYVAACPEFQDCARGGATVEEAKQNIVTAIRACLEASK